MTKTYVRDVNGDVVDADNVKMPASRAWRDAWKRNGAAIDTDMVAARKLFRGMAKRSLEERMKADIVPAFMDAVLEKDTAALAVIKGLRRASKLIDTLPAIDSATTPEELSALWDIHTDKLGPNPFK